MLFRSDLFGDAVNIAARIEPLAQPGGICVSEDVARQVRNKLSTPVQNIGKSSLKNIDLPVEVFAVSLPWQEAETQEAAATLQDRRRSKPAPVGRKSMLFVGLAAGLVLSLGVAAVWYALRSANKPASNPASEALARYAIPLADVKLSENSYLETSRDGKHIAFIAQQGNVSKLYMRSVSEPSGRFLPGTEDARFPFFSPDGQWIAFFSREKLMKVPVGGGAPIEICAASSEIGRAHV